MTQQTRRSFNQKLLGSLIGYGLIETLFHRDAFADSVKPVVGDWMKDLNNLCRDLKMAHKLKDTEFQAKLEELYKRVDLPELLKLTDFDKLARTVKLPDSGANSVGFDLRKVEGLPAQLAFGKQIFCMKKGRSVVPHGHNNMCTGFIILRGDFDGKHYDRVEDRADSYVIKPTLDRVFKPGEFSTVSDHKDNVHWFKAISDSAFIFNIHVIGYDPNFKLPSGRVYLDPEGEKTTGGMIVAKKMSSEECHKKFG